MENMIVKAEFRLIGKEVSPGRLNEVIGINCTEYEIGNDTLFWCISECGDDPTVDVFKMCQRIINKLVERKVELKAAISKYNLSPDFCVTIFSEPVSQLNDGEPGYENSFLDGEIMQFLGSIDAKFYFEFRKS